MGQPQKADRPAAPELAPWWYFWLPTVRTTTDKALDEATRPARPRVGSWEHGREAGARWTFVEWLFRI